MRLGTAWRNRAQAEKSERWAELCGIGCVCGVGARAGLISPSGDNRWLGLEEA